MRKLLFTALTALLVTAYGLDLDFKAKTGDAELDMHLKDMNVMERARLELFKAETAKEYKVEGSMIDNALLKLKLEPADLYMSLEFAKITNKKPAEVINIYSENKGEGWGAVAKRLGIKPGSREFKALKAKTKYKKDNHKRDRLKKEDVKAKKVQDEEDKDIKPVDAKPAKIDKSEVKPVKETKQNKR